MRRTSPLLTSLLLLLLYLPSYAQTTELRGKVVGVSDGDTVTVLDSSNTRHRVRCQGIDAPEKAQDFGEAAKKRMSGLVFDKEVTILADKTDRYGRTVGKIMLGGQDVCAEMIFSGLAWHYKHYESEQSSDDRRSYGEAEGRARKLKIGIWSHGAPTPPWEFRRTQQIDETAEAAPASEPAPQPGAAQEVGTAPAGGITGNSNSRIYHWPGCPNYAQIAPGNRVPFASAEEAERAGYRAARNCPSPAPAPSATAAAGTSNANTNSSGTVHVRGYYRKDGTYVRPHTRRAPRRKN